jgi:hypothetical protein
MSTPGHAENTGDNLRWAAEQQAKEQEGDQQQLDCRRTIPRSLPRPWKGPDTRPQGHDFGPRLYPPSGGGPTSDAG